MSLSQFFLVDGLAFISRSDANAAAKTGEGKKKQHLTPDVQKKAAAAPSVRITCMICTDKEEMSYLAIWGATRGDRKTVKQSFYYSDCGSEGHSTTG